MYMNYNNLKCFLFSKIGRPTQTEYTL